MPTPQKSYETVQKKHNNQSGWIQMILDFDNNEKYLHDQKKLAEMLFALTEQPDLKKQIRDDFADTLKKIWFDTTKINDVLDSFFENIEKWIASWKSVFEMEIDQYNLLKSSWVREKFREAQKNRVKTIFEQIWWMIPGNTDIIDYWTWHWEVWKKFKDESHCKVTEVDVVDYRVPEVKSDLDIDFKQFNWYEIPWGKKFNYWVLTNVAHHEEDNEKIIEELTKKVNKGLAVIETVPNLDEWNFSKKEFLKCLPEANTKLSKNILENYLKDIRFNDLVSEEEGERNIDKARKRNHASDWRRNRVVTEPMNKVPVPWTYEHRLGWLIRFANHGWLPSEITDYGYDMAWLKDKHVGYKFIKANSLDKLPEWYQFPEFKKEYKWQKALEK